MNSTKNYDHADWMRYALSLTAQAESQGEVPVAALIVNAENQLIAEAWNAPISNHDPTAHAEILAMRRAGEVLQNYRLTNCRLYVTLEPCIMCAGAMVHARISDLIYGASDPRVGAVDSYFQVLNLSELNHHVNVSGGVLAQECSEVLKGFFRERRINKTSG